MKKNNLLTNSPFYDGENLIEYPSSEEISWLLPQVENEEFSSILNNCVMDDEFQDSEDMRYMSFNSYLRNF